MFKSERGQAVGTEKKTPCNEQSLEFMIGQTLNLHYTTVTERAFFQNGDKGKHSNEAINEDI